MPSIIRERALNPPLRSLLFSTLYPSAARPTHGIFVETRLRHLLSSGAVETRVIAPVPWFPSQHPRFGAWARMAATPMEETRNGILVQHPRYLLPPKLGMNCAPLLLALGARKAIRQLIASGYDFDVIDAHYFYPDGVAATLLGQWFNRPVVITARGSDVNLLAHYALPRRLIQGAARKSAAMVTVSQALKTELIRIGASAEKIVVLRNGIDLNYFKPVPQDEARAALGLPMAGPVIVSVGNLVPLKGHRLTIEAMLQLPGAMLLIAGQGPESVRLEALVKELGLASRVRFLGQVPQSDLPRLYSAADVMVLASSREGWANVLLESMGCGTPVIATDVGGSGEVVSVPDAGLLIRERSAAAIASAILQILANPPQRASTRQYAEGFSWDDTTQGQINLFHSVTRSVTQRV